MRGGSMSYKVKLVSLTPDAERTMAYCARVSSPHQDNPEFARLLRYCMKHGHWSVFEQAHATFEIVTSRAIAQQILRHRSFTFQEFSQRYATAMDYIEYDARRQDTKNRQNSIDDLPEDVQQYFRDIQEVTWESQYKIYEKLLAKGVAKECARMILPLNTATKIYMTGSIRSWLHYFQVRCDPATQFEHREIACDIRNILYTKLPTIAEAMND